MTNPPTLISTDDAAKVLGISPRTLEKWRVTGDGPPFVAIGRRVLYRLDRLADFISERERTSTSAGAA